MQFCLVHSFLQICYSHKYMKLEDCGILLCSLIVAYCVVYWTPGKEVWAWDLADVVSLDKILNSPSASLHLGM